MPELPEVERVKKNIERYLLKRKIKNIIIKKNGILKNNEKEFKNNLVNSCFNKVNRRGKLLILKICNSEKYLLMHLRMTGQIIIKKGNKIIPGGHYLPEVKKQELPGEFTYAEFKFSNGTNMYFNDMRKFGLLKIVSTKEKESILSKFGIEPLSQEFSLNEFNKLFKNRKAKLKSLLLNQKIIAGIGNIYSDEICFNAKIRPDRNVNTLSSKEIENLYKAIKYILKKAVKNGGTTFPFKNLNKPFNEFIFVYKKEGKKCKKCNNVILNKKIGGRSSRFCNFCQK